LTSAAVLAKPLKVGGVTPFSATDYPGKIAAVIFVQGCPWRCGYCHNPHLQNRNDSGPLAWTKVRSLLRRRVGLIDAVVFSGGEPTLDAALADAMRQAREFGFAIGLHTAGAYPRRLTEVLPLVDWVGIDIKAMPSAYDAITGISDSAAPAFASAQAVLASGVAHEFRSTVHPALHSPHDILTLAQTLSAMGVRNYALQMFRSTGCANEKLPDVSSVGYLGADLLAQLHALFSEFTLRAA
jgi:anaerobic ribonucleoside-triphosphate reductase activating protein